MIEPALLQTVTHYTQEAGVRSFERAIGGIVLCKAVERAGHVDKQGLRLPHCHLPYPQRRTRKPRKLWLGAARIATRATTRPSKRKS